MFLFLFEVSFLLPLIKSNYGFYLRSTAGEGANHEALMQINRNGGAKFQASGSFVKNSHWRVARESLAQLRAHQYYQSSGGDRMTSGLQGMRLAELNGHRRENMCGLAAKKNVFRFE